MVTDTKHWTSPKRRIESKLRDQFLEGKRVYTSQEKGVELHRYIRLKFKSHSPAVMGSPDWELCSKNTHRGF
jgi:hypothetical protein